MPDSEKCPQCGFIGPIIGGPKALAVALSMGGGAVHEPGSKPCLERQLSQSVAAKEKAEARYAEIEEVVPDSDCMEHEALVAYIDAVAEEHRELAQMLCFSGEARDADKSAVDTVERIMAERNKAVAACAAMQQVVRASRKFLAIPNLSKLAGPWNSVLQKIGQLREDTARVAPSPGQALLDRLRLAEAACAAWREFGQWLYDEAHQHVSEVDGSPTTFAGQTLGRVDSLLVDDNPGQTLLDELKGLKEIVGKLLKTGDGVTAVPGMTIWWLGPDHTASPYTVVGAEPAMIGTDMETILVALPDEEIDGDLFDGVLAKWCYSTEAAARAAAEKENSHD